jgi:prepilin-type N-terminal cleavage/methylation domain-containing protein
MKKNQKAFTIVELLIATSVFSLVLLTALAGFMQIGRLFYKGVSTTATQNAAKQIIQDISGAVQNAPSTPSSGSGKYSYFCVGSTRYTYNLGHQIDLSKPADYTPPKSATLPAGTGNFGLIKDTLPGPSACATPCWPQASCKIGELVFQKDMIELMGQNMRLSLFNISSKPSVGPDFYDISLTIAYGDDTLLNNPSSTTPTCIDNIPGGQFCSVTTLSSGVYRGN